MYENLISSINSNANSKPLPDLESSSKNISSTSKSDPTSISIFESKINSEVVQTVNARDLHKFIESKQDFSTWMKSRIDQYEFVENQDFILVHRKMEQVSGAKHVIDYHVSIDMAKELAMVERNAKGKEARQYFIKCEKELIESKKSVSLWDVRGQDRIALLEKYQELVTIAIEQEKEIQFLKQQNEHKAKMLEKYRIEFDEGLVYVTQVSNEFGIGPVKFSDFLKKLNIVSDTEKTVYNEFTHLFKYTEKYISVRNEFSKVLKVNMDGVVFLIELVTNGIETVKKSNGINWDSKDFDKLSRKEIPDFVDTNILVFESIISRYRKSNIASIS